MYLITICSGQLCNQILYLVHVLATVLDSRDRRVVDLFAKDVLKFSDLHPEALPGCRVSVRAGRVTKIQSFIELFIQRFRFATTGYSGRNPCRIVRWVRTRMPKVVWSWCFRNPKAVARHRAEICAFLRVKDCYCRRPREIVESARKGAEILVGVHIRRGDYKGFRGGALWFSDEQYFGFMNQARMSLGESVRFVIVSNEPVDVEYFVSRGFDVVNASGKPQEDIVTLSLCDYIMGPSSTFSWWAAYYGNKPRWDITSAGCQVAERGFVKVTEIA